MCENDEVVKDKRNNRGAASKNASIEKVLHTNLLTATIITSSQATVQQYF